MGTWGVDTFENDAAVDWAYGLEAEDDLRLVLIAITGAIGVGEDYLDANLGVEALAACEVVARLKGNWGKRDAYTEIVDAWVLAHPEDPSEMLLEGALAAIDRIVRAPSELLELWEEGDVEAWKTAVADLRARVAG
jgi:2-methylcitrate dehydratase PrpD